MRNEPRVRISVGPENKKETDSELEECILPDVMAIAKIIGIKSL